MHTPIALPLPQAHYRPYQTLALGLQTKRRVMGFYWGRRCRKSTTAGDIYFQDLSAAAGRTVVHCSASLLLGRESIGMTLSAIERGELLAKEAAAPPSLDASRERPAKALQATKCPPETWSTRRRPRPSRDRW